jgi:hypothetical protein
MSSRIYDIEDSTDQFIDLMLKYGNVARQRSWIGQVYVLQSHGYYGGSSAKYIRYIMSIVERRGLTRYDDKARAYEARLVEEKAAKKRKKRQLETFTLVPANIPVGTIEADSKVLKKGSTVQIGVRYYEMTRSVKQLGNIIRVGGLTSVRANVRLDDVVEKAKG